MAKDNSLRDGLESFYSEILEDYKQAQRMVMTESKVINLFKKTNYPARISDFAKIKKAVIKLEIKKNIENDDLDNDLLDAFNRVKELLKDLCDAQIILQEVLKEKADKERKVTMKEYMKIMGDVQSSHERLQKSLHNLDIIYSDWLEKI